MQEEEIDANKQPPLNAVVESLTTVTQHLYIYQRDPKTFRHRKTSNQLHPNPSDTSKMQYIFPHPWGKKKLLNSIAAKLGYLVPNLTRASPEKKAGRKRLNTRASSRGIAISKELGYFDACSSVHCNEAQVPCSAPIEPSLLNHALPSNIPLAYPSAVVDCKADKRMKPVWVFVCYLVPWLDQKQTAPRGWWWR